MWEFGSVTSLWSRLMPVSTFWSFWHNFLKKKKELQSYLSEHLFTIEVFAPPLSLIPPPPSYSTPPLWFPELDYWHVIRGWWCNHSSREPTNTTDVILPSLCGRVSWGFTPPPFFVRLCILLYRPICVCIIVCISLNYCEVVLFKKCFIFVKATFWIIVRLARLTERTLNDFCSFF